MEPQGPAFTTRPWPLTRRLVVDAGAWSRRKNIIHVLAEFDVTRAREVIRSRAERTGERLSFTAFIAACIGRAVATDRLWHADRKGSRLILYEDVDIAILVERMVERAKLATFHIVRGADAKSVEDIHREIRAAQQENVDASPGAGRWKALLRLPGPLRRLLYRWLDVSPQTRKRLAGTVILTAIGMYGKGGGWGVPIPSNTLTVTVGGIGVKPGVADGRVEPREILSITVSFDHDIVDGAPAARFVACLRDLVEPAALIGD